MKLATNLYRFLVFIAVITVSGLVTAQTCPDNLVGYWKMDEVSGTLLTEVKSGFNATRNSSTGPISGKEGNSQRFTYTVNASNNAYTYSEFAVVPDNSAFDFPAGASFTISYWVRFSDYGYGFQDHIFFSKGDWYGGGAGTGGMFASGCNGSAKINFLLRDDTGKGVNEDTETELGFGDGNWHHVALVRNNATNMNTIYVDGINRAEREVIYNSGFGSTFDLKFGTLASSGINKYFYKGDLDELAIFNTALTAGQISEIIANVNDGGICQLTTEAPSITSTAVEDAVVGELYTYNVDATGSPASITYSLTSSPAGMSINASTGVISWTPATVGSYDVTVKADNGIEPFDTQSFTVSVTGSFPEFTSTPVTDAALGELYQYTAHASGTQTGMLYALVTSPGGMTMNASSGLVSWTPDAVGTYPIVIRANNNIAPADTQRFSITVAGASPQITSSPVTTAFITVPYYYSVEASGTSIGMTFSLVEKPASMSINATTGLISWTPDALGDFTVRVVADNGIDPADEQEFVISVIEPTNCPDGIISLHRLDEAAGPDYVDFYDEHNASATVSPTASVGIIDGAQTFSATTGIDIPDNGTEFDWLSRKSFSFEGWIKSTNTAAMVMVGRYRTDYGGVIARWYVGTNSLGQATFELRDNGGPNRVVSGTTVVTDGDWHHIVAVRDGDANLNKIFVDGVQEASVSYTYTHSFKADDPLVATIGYLKGAASEMHFIGAIDEVAIFNRALAATEVATFYNGGVPSGHCRGSNNFPYFSSNPVTSVNEDASYSYAAVVDDPDAGDVLSITAITKPSWVVFNYTSGSKNATLSGTPTNSNVGDNNDVVLRVTDGVMSRDQIFRIFVNNVNDAPVKTSTPTTSVNEATNYSYILTVNDVDLGDVITMTKTTLPSWLTFTWSAGSRTATITGTPDDANVGSNSIDISISDGHVTIHESYILTVVPVNDVPQINGQQSIFVDEDMAKTIQKTDLVIFDPDNAASDITLEVQAGTNYTFTGNTITPAANYNGQLHVNVVARDLASVSQVYQAAVTVYAKNDVPVITGQNALSVNKNGSITLLKSDLTITDVDDNASDISITVQAGTNYTFAGNVITPNTDFTGQLNVNVIANDLSNSSLVYPVIITVVSSGNEPPVITGQNALSVNEDEPVTIHKTDLTITDSDNVSSEITITVQNGSNYTHVGNVVTPAANFNGQLTVNVIASDLSDDSQVFGVVITVNAVNDKPEIATSPSLSVTAGTLYAYIFTVTDVDNASLTRSSIILPAWLTFVPETGILTGTPSNDQAGPHLVTLRVSDGTEDVDLSFTITVSPSTATGRISEVSMVLFPTPADNMLNIRFENLNEDTYVDIISTTGAVVMTQMVPANTKDTHLGVQHLNPGVYICHIRNSNLNKIQRFMISR